MQLEPLDAVDRVEHAPHASAPSTATRSVSRSSSAWPPTIRRRRRERLASAKNSSSVSPPDARLQLPPRCPRRRRGRGRSPRSGRRAGRPPRGTAWSAGRSSPPRRARSPRPTRRGGCAGRARSSARRGTAPAGGRRGSSRCRAGAASRRSRSATRRSAASTRSNRSSSSAARARGTRRRRAIIRRFSAPVEQVVDGGLLGGEADRGADGVRVVDDVVSGDAGGAAVGREQRGEDPDGRRLAGAVRAEQREHLAGLDGEVEPVEDARRAERLRKALRLDCVCHTQKCMAYTSLDGKGSERRPRRGRRDRARRRGRARRGLDGARGRAARVHDDVALPARREQGGARVADARRRARPGPGVRDARTGAPVWSAGRASSAPCCCGIRGASTSRSRARSRPSARSRGSTAGSRRWTRPACTRASRPTSSCCSTATCSGPCGWRSRWPPRRRSRWSPSAFDLDALPFLRGAIESGAFEDEYTDDENFQSGLDRVLDGIGVLIARRA